MTATEHDAVHLSRLQVAAAASLNIDSFTFNYLPMDDHSTLTVSLTPILM